MAIPDFQSIMRPLLEHLADGRERSIRECIRELADHFGLSPEEREQLLSSGNQRIFDNRVAWARSYLKEAGLIESPGRGIVRITPRGKAFLSDYTGAINTKVLMRFDEFVEFRRKSSRRARHIDSKGTQLPTDIEKQINNIYQRYYTNLTRELLERVEQLTPAAFQRFVTILFARMGYGKVKIKTMTLNPKSSTFIIEGTVNKDPLGLDIIYLQAHQTNQPINLNEMQNLESNLRRFKAQKGLIITTSYFQEDVKDYINQMEQRIVMIDGDTLARLMIDNDVGVMLKSTYYLKIIDHDFFEK